MLNRVLKIRGKTRHLFRVKSAALLCLGILSTPVTAATVDSPTAYWSGVWDQCYDVHLEGFDSRIEEFKRFLVQGRNWEKQVIRECAAIDSLISTTCKAWAPDPNGNEPLEEFRKKYAWIYKQTISINDKAKGNLLPKLKLWTKLEEAELAKIEPFQGEQATWDMFPCSVAWANTEARINAALAALESKLKVMREKCPIAADDLPTVVTTTSFAEGSGKNIPVVKGAHPRTGSDITNTQNAIQDQKKSKAIIDGQK